MNKVILIGRLTRDPDVRWSQGQDQKAVARYTMAVDRRIKAQDGQQSADFISCVAFGKAAEFAEKYFHKGIKIAVTGRIQTGKYVNKDGQTVYSTDVVIEEQEFVESKNAGAQDASGQQDASAGQQDASWQQMAAPAGQQGGWADAPDELPFK